MNSICCYDDDVTLVSKRDEMAIWYIWLQYYHPFLPQICVVGGGFHVPLLVQTDFSSEVEK